jgi:adenylate kinase
MSLQPKKPRPIFVGGIHGVGKSTICSDICAEFNIPHLTASDLIRQYKKETLIQDVDREKRVGNISTNQDILITALNNSVIEDDTYILDGHFTLFDSLGLVKPIPTNVFFQIKPKALFVITEKPETIQLRLMDRDESDYNLYKLSEMQKAETVHARRVSEEIGVNLHEVSSSQLDLLRDYIKDIIS